MSQPEETIIKLRKPVTLGSGDGAITYTELTLREPTAGELEKGSRADTSVGMIINMITDIAKVPRAVAERLSQRDFAEANEYLSGFTQPGAAEDGAT